MGELLSSNSIYIDYFTPVTAYITYNYGLKLTEAGRCAAGGYAKPNKNTGAKQVIFHDIAVQRC
ncbi:hypothetical protein GCM10027037_24260 [Mucilaginibacter koreensis]